MNYVHEGKEYYIDLIPNESTQQLIERCEYIFVKKKDLDFAERIRLSKIWHYVNFQGCKYSDSVMKMI